MSTTRGLAQLVCLCATAQHKSSRDLVAQARDCTHFRKIGRKWTFALADASSIGRREVRDQRSDIARLGHVEAVPRQQCDVQPQETDSVVRGQAMGRECRMSVKYSCHSFPASGRPYRARSSWTKRDPSGWR